MLCPPRGYSLIIFRPCTAKLEVKLESDGEVCNISMSSAPWAVECTWTNLNGSLVVLCPMHVPNICEPIFSVCDL